MSKRDPRFNTSPAFGYAGFVLPATEARRFGMWFAEEKRKVFAAELAASAHRLGGIGPSRRRPGCPIGSFDLRD